MQTHINAQGTTHPTPAHKPAEALDKLADGAIGGFVNSIVHVAADALHKVEEVGEKAAHIVSDTAHHAIDSASHVLDSAKGTANTVFEKVIEGGEVAAEVSSDAIESVSDAAVITGVVVAHATEKAATVAQHAVDSASVAAHHAVDSASVVAHHAMDSASVAAHHAMDSASYIAHSASVAAHHAIDSASYAAASAQGVALAAKDKASEKLEEAKIVASDALATAADAVVTARATTSEAVESAKITVTNVVESAKTTAAVAVESAKTTAVDALESAKATAAQASDAVTDAAISAQARAVSTLDSAKEAASDAAQSLTTTASELSENAQEKVTELHDTLDSAAARAAESADKLSGTGLALTMDVVAHLQRIADRTGDALLHATACKAHSAYAKGLSEAPGVHLTTVTPQQAGELLNLAIQTQDRELADFARYCQSVAATSGIAVEPTPGKILQEIEKGRAELQSQGRVHTGPGYGAAFASVSTNKAQKATDANQAEQSQTSSTPALELTMAAVSHLQRIADRTGDALLHDTARKAHSACAKGIHEAPGVHLTSVTPQQANELLNLAIRTQDRELADFARYCQSVAATNSVAIEPTPGKIEQEIEKGKQELQQQGRVHTGPGYGAAFASVSSQKAAANNNAPLAAEIQPSTSEPTTYTSVLTLSQDVVSHLQRIADRTGDALLLETARKAHSAFAKGLHEAPGVHLTRITSEQANELLNLAIQTQDRELADFARYCQSVASTNQVAVEPTPGKIAQEIEKGRVELKQQGRTHTGPGYGAAFASAPKQ